jgi:hypothetical protein
MGTKELNMVEGPDGLTTVSGKCVFTGEEYSCQVPTDGIKMWLNGERIHRALPGVSLDDREFLISGISPNGWKKTFG